MGESPLYIWLNSFMPSAAVWYEAGYVYEQNTRQWLKVDPDGILIKHRGVTGHEMIQFTGKHQVENWHLFTGNTYSYLGRLASYEDVIKVNSHVPKLRVSED